MAAYPDVEQLLCDWLIARHGAGPDGLFRRIVTEVPPDMLAFGATPCAVLERFGGADSVVGLDNPRVNVDVFCAGTDPLVARAAALARGEDIRRAIRLHLVGTALGPFGPVVSRVRVESAPTIRPYDSRNQIRRSQAVYEIRLHSRLTD